MLLTDDTVLIMSGEAHYNLSGMANKQNLRYWSPKNPQNLHEKVEDVARGKLFGVKYLEPYFSMNTDELCLLKHLAMLSNYLLL